MPGRFWRKVDKTDSCWNWTAATLVKGYGRFGIGNKKLMLAHRWAYIDAYGPIPPYEVIDHLCRNRSCVRPDHLEAVGLLVNSARGRVQLVESERSYPCSDGVCVCRWCGREIWAAGEGR